MGKNNYSEEESRLTCKICGRKYDHLGSHIAKAHGMRTRSYKEKFGLPYNYSLISEKVLEKKRANFDPKTLKNLSVNNRFKKGQVPKKKYRSKYELEQATKNIQRVNSKRKLELCPICKIGYYHLDNHLMMKHRLMRI